MFDVDGSVCRGKIPIDVDEEYCIRSKLHVFINKKAENSQPLKKLYDYLNEIEFLRIINS